MKSSRNEELREFIYGSFACTYHLVKEERKSCNLTVKPDLRVVLSCPLNVTDGYIEAFMRRKWLWIHKQLTHFRKFQKKAYVRENISGESLYYLGKQYQLIVKNGTEDGVVLDRNTFIIYTVQKNPSSRDVKLMIKRWYAEKTKKIFKHRFEIVKSKFDYPRMPVLIIKAMKRRWGSCLRKEKIVLNPKLIQAPRECIDYVLTHELCHIKYKNHDKNFFALLKVKCPRWEKIKDKLEVRFG